MQQKLRVLFQQSYLRGGNPIILLSLFFFLTVRADKIIAVVVHVLTCAARVGCYAKMPATAIL